MGTNTTHFDKGQIDDNIVKNKIRTNKYICIYFECLF